MQLAETIVSVAKACDLQYIFFFVDALQPTFVGKQRQHLFFFPIQRRFDRRTGIIGNLQSGSGFVPSWNRIRQMNTVSHIPGVEGKSLPGIITPILFFGFLRHDGMRAAKLHPEIS